MNYDIMFDSKTGIDYEEVIVNFLKGLNFTANRVGNNDGGVDIFASITLNSTEYNFNIQCKYFNKPLGKGPIQEVFTGTYYYDNGAIPVVCTNNTITRNARLYAKKVGVEVIADMEWREIENVMKTKSVTNSNHVTLMSIILSLITHNDSLLPSKTNEKKPEQTDKERLRLEIINNYEMAEELSRESAKLTLEAANKAQESLRLQKQAMLMNLEYG